MRQARPFGCSRLWAAAAPCRGGRMWPARLPLPQAAARPFLLLPRLRRTTLTLCPPSPAIVKGRAIQIERTGRTRVAAGCMSMRIPMKQSGFTLLEVLVAMLVLSIGLLGLAGLMASSMRNNQSAYHTHPGHLACLRHPRPHAGQSHGCAGRRLQRATLWAARLPARPTAPSGSIAAQDIGGWKNMIACALPEGDGSITVTPGK